MSECRTCKHLHEEYKGCDHCCDYSGYVAVTDRNVLDHKDEVNEMISKVHEALEGRYELNGEDLHTIQFLLCQHANHIPDIKKKVDHLPDTGKVMRAEKFYPIWNSNPDNHYMGLIGFAADYAAYVSEIKAKEFCRWYFSISNIDVDEIYRRWKAAGK